MVQFNPIAVKRSGFGASWQRRWTRGIDELLVLIAVIRNTVRRRTLGVDVCGEVGNRVVVGRSQQNLRCCPRRVDYSKMGNEQMDVDRDVTVFLKKARSEAPDALKQFFTKFEELYDRKSVPRRRVSSGADHRTQTMAPTHGRSRELCRTAGRGAVFDPRLRELHRRL